DRGGETKDVRGQVGGGEHVADVAGTPPSGDDRGGPAGCLGQHGCQFGDGARAAGAHVERAGDGVGGSEGEYVGARHVLHVDEVPALVAVLVHLGRPAGGQ